MSAPLWVVGLVANEPAAFLGPIAFGQTIAISIVAFSVMALVMLIADCLPVVRRLEGMRAYVAIGVVVIVAAESRLAVFVVGFSAAGLPNDVPLATRAVSSALLALIGYGFAGLAIDSWMTYRAERNRLMASVVDSSRRVDGHDAAVAAMSATLRMVMQGQLAEARPAIMHELEQLKSALAHGHDGRAELEKVQAVTDDRWKKISADMWARATPGLPPPGFAEFLRAFVRTRPFSLPAVFMGAAAMAFFVFGRALDPMAATQALSLWLVIALTATGATNLLVRRFPAHASVTVATSIAVLVAFPLWLALVGVIAGDDTAMLARIAFININVVVVLVLAGVSPAIAHNRDAVLTALKNTRDRESVHQLHAESQLLVVAQGLAAALHGSSRSDFMAATLRLEAALDRGDRADALALVDDLSDTIFGVEEAVEASRRTVTVSDLDDLIENWRSVCDIEVDGSWHDVAESLLSDVHTLTVEAISDAMRHGDCTHISIVLTTAASCTHLTVVNNGRPMPADRSAGLGTALLDRLAPGQWSRTTGPDGLTRLVVTLHERARF